LKYSLIVFLGILIYIGAVFAPVDLFAQTDEVIIESLTQNQTITSNNQTTINLYVTTNQPSENNYSINGSVMISSAIIIGFVGFTQIINIGAVMKDIKEHAAIRAALFVIIGIIIVLHLTVIGLAFSGDLDKDQYLFVIIVTILCVILIIILSAYLFHHISTYEDRKHKERNRIKAIKRRSGSENSGGSPF